MQFENRATQDACGWTLAHSVALPDTKPGRLAKGTHLTQHHITLLLAAGIAEVYVFRLEQGDVGEDEAAHQIASTVCGEGLLAEKAARGRSNLYAKADGLLLVDPRVHALNATDEAITLATLPHRARVRGNQLVATAKIIPYATDRATLDRARATGATLSLAPFRPFSASLIVTGGQNTDKIRHMTQARLQAVQGNITGFTEASHTVPDLARVLASAVDTNPDLILLLGVSAISDRRDVIPAALETAGGGIISLGMPVDPGNLLMLGALRGTTVIGLPGCARSPAFNGLDWVLERFAAGLPMDRKEFAAMGVGGLLKETAHRPAPRVPRHQQKKPVVQPVILAAGRSSRAGGANKLLSLMNDQPVIRQTVSVAGAAASLSPLVVVGHMADDVSAALTDLPHTLVLNPGFADGMASSLKAALSHCDPRTELLMVCLGDMPFVQKETFAALIDAATRCAEPHIFIPTFHGKRGNPVIWRREMFAALAGIEGDKGGKDVIHANTELVCEVPVNDPGILIDLDTPETLAQFGITPAS